VHRLDKGTSGVLLFALSAEVARTLGQAFESGDGLQKPTAPWCAAGLRNRA
jgi:tRNA pseudouridine65 synthase